MREVSDELDVPPSTLRRWVAQSLYGGPERSDRHPDDCQCFTCWRRKTT